MSASRPISVVSHPSAVPDKAFYMPELDVARAFAFVAVFASHWIPMDLDYYAQHRVPRAAARMLSALSSAGMIGVMLFFCLSSYLITQLLLKEIGRRGRIDVGAFYMRRVLRIWPLYLTFTAVAALLPFIDSAQQFGARTTLAFVFFSGNWIWALGGSLNTVAIPLWSISVEEQFYLCWPWVVRRVTRDGLKRTVIGLLVLSTVNRVLVISDVLHTDLWHSTFNQLDSIGLGALLALGVGERAERLRDRARPILLCAALLVIYLVQFWANPFTVGWSHLLYYPLVSLCCAIVLFSVVGSRFDASSALSRTLLYLGKISYGLYVLHLFAFYLVNKLYVASQIKLHFVLVFTLRGAAALALTVALATLSYRWLERPFLRFKSRFA